MCDVVMPNICAVTSYSMLNKHNDVICVGTDIVESVIEHQD